MPANNSNIGSSSQQAPDKLEWIELPTPQVRVLRHKAAEAEQCACPGVNRDKVVPEC